MTIRKKRSAHLATAPRPRRPVRPSDLPTVPESRSADKTADTAPEEPEDEALRRMLEAAYT